MSEAHGPLRGVKVVSCSTAQAGTVPYMLMADLGADVIKIEAPDGGDCSRVASVLPGMPSTFFETNNRGVKSVTLNLKLPEARAILHKLVADADIFGQNFRPGAAEKNGFGWEDLRKINPRLVYMSISGYGPNGPNADLPGTDSMAQALGGIAQAYATPGQPLKTGVVSVADETCAILAFGGALAALTHARSTGVGQKVDCSLLGGQIRLMGWTLTTAMWRNRDPVTGQARVAGTREKPAMSASFSDRDGKPFVMQLARDQWKEALDALGFYETMDQAGFGQLGVAMELDEVREALLKKLGELFATGTRDEWVARLRERRHRLGADQHHARGRRRSGRDRQRLRRRGRLSEIRQAAEGARHAMAIFRDAGEDRHRPGARRAQQRSAGRASATPRRRSRISRRGR